MEVRRRTDRGDTLAQEAVVVASIMVVVALVLLQRGRRRDMATTRFKHAKDWKWGGVLLVFLSCCWMEKIVSRTDSRRFFFLSFVVGKLLIADGNGTMMMNKSSSSHKIQCMVWYQRKGRVPTVKRNTEKQFASLVGVPKPNACHPSGHSREPQRGADP